MTVGKVGGGSTNGTWGKKEMTRLFSAHSDALVFTGSCPKAYEPIVNSQEVPGSFMTGHTSQRCPETTLVRTEGLRPALLT